MDEAMVERVRTWVSDAVEAEKRAERGSLAEIVEAFGHGYYRTSEMGVEDCKVFSDSFAESALVQRAPRANKAKHAEEVEELLTTARFWETAAAMLIAAEVKTLGELLEDEELGFGGGFDFPPDCCAVVGEE